MNLRELIHRTHYNLPRLAEESGVALNYLKGISSGRYQAGPATQAKLAAAFLKQAEVLREAAAALAPPQAENEQPRAD